MLIIECEIAWPSVFSVWWVVKRDTGSANKLVLFCVILHMHSVSVTVPLVSIVFL